MPIHHFTSNGARPRSTSALTCKSSASSFISFALKAIRPVHFCETVDREQRNVSATSACVRPLSPIRRLTFSPTVGESTKMFSHSHLTTNMVRHARSACRVLSFLSVSLNLCAMTTATISPKVAAQAESVSLQDIVTRNMKVAMTLRNVKQKDLANALGVDRSSISQKMTRRVAWSLEDIEKASDFFHVKPEALVAGHGFEPWGF